MMKKPMTLLARLPASSAIAFRPNFCDRLIIGIIGRESEILREGHLGRESRHTGMRANLAVTQVAADARQCFLPEHLGTTSQGPPTLLGGRTHETDRGHAQKSRQVKWTGVVADQKIQAFQRGCKPQNISTTDDRSRCPARPFCYFFQHQSL